MKIKKISGWKLDLPLKDGRYAWADGKFVEVFDSTIVQIQTDQGISGFGESCPLGAGLPAIAPGRCPCRNQDDCSTPDREGPDKHQSGQPVDGFDPARSS